MVIFIYGTTGESIKIATLVESIPRDKVILIDTNQQPKLLDKFYKATTFPRPDFTVSNGWRGNDLTKPWQMFFWLFAVVKNFYFGGAYKRVKRAKKDERAVVIVHGDTVTTVIGAIFGRLSGLKVAHVEAGLRSGSWRHPFPEEIDRRIVSKLAHINYAPGKVPYEALTNEGVKGEIIDTAANTVADSALWARRQKPSMLPKLPKSFCLVSVHRNELLVSPKQVEGLLVALKTFAQQGNKVVFLDHPITSERIKGLGMDSILDDKNILRIPKQDYVNMMHIIDSAEVLVTDSGGLQEESYYLGIPCIVYREATERSEGLGENVVLTGLNPKRLLEELGHFKISLIKRTKSNYQPTKIIVEDLKSRDLI